MTLFDPWINDPAKFAPLWGSLHEDPLVVRELPQPDILLISQNAPDHCDVSAISKLSRETEVIAPEDCVTKLQRLGFNPKAMRPGESLNIKGLKISAIPSEHPGVLKQLGFLLEGSSAKVLVLADPAFTQDLIAAVKALPKSIDAVLVASTAFTLRYFGQIVMTPEEAAQICEYVGARHAFPTRTLMHEGVWGLLGGILVKSYVTPEESFNRFSVELKKRSPSTTIHKLERGQGWNNAA